MSRGLGPAASTPCAPLAVCDASPDRPAARLPRCHTERRVLLRVPFVTCEKSSNAANISGCDTHFGAQTYVASPPPWPMIAVWIRGSSARQLREASPMRTAYHKQLADLTAQLGDMCGLAGVAMKLATQALLEADINAAEQVVRDHERIVAMRAQAEKEGFALLALQQPVAGELRAIFSAVQIIADAERMGALAVHVAKIARRQYPRQVLPEEVRERFAEMSKLAIALSDGAKEALVTRDPRKAAELHE